MANTNPWPRAITITYPLFSGFLFIEVKDDMGSPLSAVHYNLLYKFKVGRLPTHFIEMSNYQSK